jgi:DNA gyrase subunit A
MGERTGERTGIGLVERLVLQTMADIDAVRNGPHLKCARIAGMVRSDHGIHDEQAYSTLCTLAVDWLQSVPLVDGHGNFGSTDFSPAGSRYTEARLTEVGLLAVQSERGDLPKLPFGLILGDMYAGGTAPPFEPSRVLDALTLAIDRLDAADRELAAAIGPPMFPTGCSVNVDMSALHGGDQTRLRMSARISVEDVDGGTRLVLTNLPLRIGRNDVVLSILGRSRPVEDTDRHPELAAATRLPIIGLNDESDRRGTRIVCTLRAGADIDQTIDRLLDLWPVSVERSCRLDAPIGTLIRQAVDDDRAAQLDAIARLRAAIVR